MENGKADSFDSLDSPTNNVVPSFSFSGCGFLGVYHVGVAACLRDHTDVSSRREIKFAGASAGALVATTLLCDINFGMCGLFAQRLENLHCINLDQIHVLEVRNLK